MTHHWVPTGNLRAASPDEEKQTGAAPPESSAPQDKKAYGKLLKDLSTMEELKEVVKLTRKELPYSEEKRSSRAKLEATLGVMQEARDKLLAAYNGKFGEGKGQDKVMKLFQFTYQSVIGDLNGEPERLHVALRELVDRAQKRAKAGVGEVHIDIAPIADSDESAAPAGGNVGVAPAPANLRLYLAQGSVWEANTSAGEAPADGE